MSGKFVIKKERTRYRFELLDETGEVVFKGSVNTTKAAVERQLKLIAEFGDDLPNHFQAVEGRIGNTWVIRGEEHSAREGEQGRVGDAIPLGFGVLAGEALLLLAEPPLYGLWTGLLTAAIILFNFAGVWAMARMLLPKLLGRRGRALVSTVDNWIKK